MGILFSLLTAVLFSLANVYNRKADKKFTGLEAMALNIGFNAIFIFPLSIIFKLIQGTPWPDLQTTFLYILVGFVSVFLGRWGLFNTIRYLGPSRASVIKNSAPAFALVLAILFLNQWPTTLSFIGIVIILIAIWLLGWRKGGPKKAAQPSDSAGGLSTWQKGMLLGAGVAFLFAFADVLRTFSVQRAPDVVLAAGISGLAGWVALILYLMFKGKLVETHRKHWKSWDKYILMATLCSGLSSITNFIAIKYLYVAYVSALFAPAPLMTAFFSYMLSRDDEKFGTTFFISVILMVGGAVLIGLYK